MKDLLCNRWVRTALWVGVPAALVLVLCWRWRIWGPRDAIQYFGTVRHSAVGEDLWFGRIAAGQDEKELLAKHPCRRQLVYGRFKELGYPLIPLRSGFGIVLKDGKVVGAVGADWGWKRSFIPMSKADTEGLEMEFQDWKAKGWRRWKTRCAATALAAASPYPNPFFACGVLAEVGSMVAVPEL